MQHLNEEQLVLHHYHDDGDDGVAAAAAEQHLSTCADCRAQYDTLCRVLALVDDLPVPQRGGEYGTEVWNRLRWRLGRRDRARVWQAVAAAAMIALVFFGGGLWWAKKNASRESRIATGGETTATAATPANVPAPSPNHDRILLVVVGDHLDNSERMLTELTNADASRGLDVTAERRRAMELVAANRLYRQTAERNHAERLAAVLSELEPVLVELSHADDNLSPAELTSLQKRINSKELLFKVRIVSAQADGREQHPVAQPKGTNSL